MTHLYTPYYCEENIWHLCADESVPGNEKHVIWIGSLNQYCPLWCQRASANANQPVWWDYHVVLVAKTHQWQVWDLDTTLPCPVSIEEYLQQTFRAEQSHPASFRMMSASYYRSHFSSDRAHMRDANNFYLAPPPQWPVISNAPLTMPEMLDFTSDKHGELLSLAGLHALYT